MIVRFCLAHRSFSCDLRAMDTNIPTALTKRAAALAAESNRSADELITLALSNGLDAWEREYRLIQKGVDQAQRGEFATEADIQTLLNKYRPEA